MSITDRRAAVACAALPRADALPPPCVSPVRLRVAALAMTALALTGCASFSADGGLGSVSSLARPHTGQDVTLARGVAAPAAVDALLAQPLSADAAVRLALLNNRGLQVSLAELGVAEADFVQAGRLRNPAFTFSKLRGGENEIERSVLFDLAGLLTLPARQGIERGRFEQAKLQAAAQVVQLATDTRRAFFTAVAAAQSVQFQERASLAAEASAELTRRMVRAGNSSKLDQAREQLFHAETLAQLARTRHQATVAREQLMRCLGLSGAGKSITLPERLPELPAAERDSARAEALALTQRFDLQMARRDLEATAAALGLTRATRFVNVLDAGYANKSIDGAPRANGYQVSLELPLFDWGSARSARAEALYMQALHRTADSALRARSEVRQAYSAYRMAYAVARRYRDEVMPLRKQVADEVLLRYNGMLASTFELLTDAREQIAAVNTTIEAERDFWLADTDLEAAMTGSASPNDERSKR